MNALTAWIAPFHFLRPAWLLLFIPVLLILWRLWKREAAEHAWRRVIPDHLLSQLLLRGEAGQRVWQPLSALSLLLLLGVLSLAGPTWERRASPLSEDRAALVIALKVTPSMLARDIQPSRLERSVHKIRDLLALRPGARTALIAYAGSAHLVMPLTRDAGIIETFAAELDPRIMPRAGDAAAAAVALANERLAGSGRPGSILLIADSVAADQLEGLRRQRAEGGAGVELLAMAAGPEVIPPPDSPPGPALDAAAMREAAAAAGGELVLPTVDDADVQRIARRLARSLAAAETQAGDYWKDAGYYLVPPLVLIALFGFRRGWVVRHD